MIQLRSFWCLIAAVVLASCPPVTLGGSDVGHLILTENANDEGLPAYKIETPTTTWFLEKTGAGLSSLIDQDGNDWLSFNPQPGSKAEGEYRGFPNAVHQQAGNFFHPKNDGTDRAITRVDFAGPDRVTISATSDNGLWGCRYDFFPTHCDFTMTRMPPHYRYWALYEGTPGGSYNDDDWWMTSSVSQRQMMSKPHEGDIPAPEWIAFGDANLERALFLFHHEDDEHPDNFYAMNRAMTVFGFGRDGLRKSLQTVPQTISIGLVETTDHATIDTAIDGVASRSVPASLDRGALFPPAGRFYKLHRLQMGADHGNIKYAENDNWFRVNSPGVSLNPKIKQRHEVRYNGLMMLRADADITSLAGAELALEVWGGHPGTYNKRVTVNGRNTYALPEVGSGDNHCTHSYPNIALALSDLVNGYNAFQFACDKVDGWGHYIVHDACLRLQLPEDHPDLVSSGLNDFTASVDAKVSTENPERMIVSMDGLTEHRESIARVDFQAFYEGYDENGNTLYRDWHGLTYQRRPVAWVGSSETAPLRCEWDVSMLPSQEDVSLRAVVTFKNPENLVYVTAPRYGLSIAPRADHKVALLSPKEIPIPFGLGRIV